MTRTCPTGWSRNWPRSSPGRLTSGMPVWPAPDPDVWAYAATNRLVLVSKDIDFQQRALLYGHPPKVIWVRSGNGPTTAVAV